MQQLRVLFICARNQWRSPTAEQLYANDERLIVRSAGVSQQARRHVSEKDLAWANVVICMEYAHARRLREMFSHAQLPPTEVLDIDDDYEFMDPELVDLIIAGTEEVLAGYLDQ